MAETESGNAGRTEDTKQPFVSQEDRPEVRLTLDTPLSELRVRELTAILGVLGSKNPNFEYGKTFMKDFFEKPEPDVIKGKVEKNEKLEKVEKWEKNEKLEKNEKNEKNEAKDRLKSEKTESETLLAPESDPRLQQVVEALTGLTEQVSELANQVEELRARVPGDQ